MMPAATLPLVQTPEEIYLRAALAGLTPDPVLTVSEWADNYRILSTRASSEPHQWRTSRTPYLRDVMDALSPTSRWQRIVFLKASQIGATEAAMNWLGYIMHRSPGPALAVQPTTEMAKRLSKQRLDPMILASPELRQRVSDRRAKDSGNTMLAKEFPGGILVLTGANSASGLRSMPVRFLFLDEIDAYPFDLDGEGDPVNLAIARTRTFPQRKIFMASTPSRTGSSRIERLDEEGDKRVYEVPCPHCGEMQPLEFSQLRWPKDQPRQATYYCRGCAKAVPEAAKTRMLAGGRWRATAEGDGVTIGFRLSSLYSPLGWFSWGEAAESYERAGKNPQDLQVFHNTVLGESFADSGETPDDHRLYERREAYPIGLVPKGAGALTAGADVQRDRIEVEILAWGPRRESWSIDYRVFYGDTSQPAVWEKMTALVDETFPSETGGSLQLAKLAVDTGYNSLVVYSWARTMSSSRVMCVHGDSRAAALLGASSVIEVGPQGQRVRFGVRLWPINTSIGKEELYRNLRLPAPEIEKGEPFPAGYCHFPQYAMEYFAQLCAEKLMTRMVNGYPKPYWQQTRERNDALDARIYARAAAAASRIDGWSEERWKQVLDDLVTKRVDEQPAWRGISQRGLSPMPKPPNHGPDDPYLD
jgi:phage terminase large subunit GpA-like protein